MHTQSITHRYGHCLQEHVCAFTSTLTFPTLSTHGADQPNTASTEHLIALKTKESLGNVLVTHHLFSLA